MASPAQTEKATSPLIPTYGKNLKALCMTEFQSPLELQLGLGSFIPLWEQGVTLRWRLNQNSFAFYQQGEALMASVRTLITAGMTAWGDSAPVKYAEAATDETADFDVVMQNAPNCNSSGGCVLASAFFPDSGKHTMKIYPTMFQQSAEEQVETLVHEIGHTFGLRHYFADKESIPGVLFGADARFSIMNYNEESVLTDTDRSDLKVLYQAVWSGQLKSIKDIETGKDVPIQLFKPFHTMG